MNKRAKILITLALIASIGCVSSVAYAAYNITSDTSAFLSLNVSKINIDSSCLSLKQQDISNLKVTNKHQIITKDTLNLKFYFDDISYNNSANDKFDQMYMGLKFTLHIPNLELYRHIENEVCFNKSGFSILGQRNQIIYQVGSNYTYLEKGISKECFKSDEINKNIEVLIPFSSDIGTPNLRSLDPDGRTDSTWYFTCNFDFNLIKENETYSKVFDGTHLNGSSLRISTEYLK